MTKIYSEICFWPKGIVGQENKYKSSSQSSPALAAVTRMMTMAYHYHPVGHQRRVGTGCDWCGHWVVDTLDTVDTVESMDTRRSEKTFQYKRVHCSVKTPSTVRTPITESAQLAANTGEYWWSMVKFTIGECWWSAAYCNWHVEMWQNPTLINCKGDFLLSDK